MKLNLYLIEDDQRKSPWLPVFVQELSARFPHLKIESKNQPDAFRDSGNVNFIERALSDSDGLIILDLFLTGDTRESVADALIATQSIGNNDWMFIWKKFGGPNEERPDGPIEMRSKLASVVAFLAYRAGRRVVWNSTQGDIPQYYGPLQRIVAGWPLIYWPKLDMNPRRPDHMQEAIREWRDSFTLNSNALNAMLEAFRQPYLYAQGAWKSAREALKIGEFTDNVGNAYQDLFSTSHRVDGDAKREGEMHYPGHHEELARKANGVAMRAIADSVLHDVLDEHLIWFLKGIHRGDQIYLPTLQSILHPRTIDKLSLFRVVACERECAGLFLKAIQTLKSQSWQCESVVTDGEQVTVRLRGKQYGTPQEAERSAETLRLSPRERMNCDSSRNDPGPCVLALDYLKPVSISADGTCVFITLIKQLQPIT